MHLKIAREDEFIPEWNHNKKDSASIKIHFKFMTSEQEERFAKMRPTYHGDMANTEDQEITIDLESHNNDIWDACVTSVENVIDEDTNKPVTKPLAIRNIPGIYGLVTEVVAHIKGGIEALEEKN